MTMRRSWAFATLAAACALALGGCSKEVDSAARAPAGAATTGSADAGAASQQLARPGAGLNGGLANKPVAGASAATATLGAGPAAEGSRNLTTKSSVGNR
jgi:hypothetical protein